MENLVLLVFLVGATLISQMSSSLIPECKPWCEGVDCLPLHVTRIPDGLCACGRVMLGADTWARHRLTVETGPNNSLAIRWKLKIQPASNSAVLYLPTHLHDVGYCYNITTKQVPQYVPFVKITCSHRDQINRKDPMLKLMDMDYYENIAVTKQTQNKRRSRRKRSFGRPARSSRKCRCWIPDQVFMKMIDNKTIEVMWQPFSAGSDIRIRIEPYGNNNRDNIHDIIIGLPNLCLKRKNGHRFTNLSPGKYVGMVGSHGCDCVNYKRSEPFPLIIPIEETTTTRLATTTKAAVKIQDKHVENIALLVIGALAFIGCSSLGLVCVIKRRFIFCVQRKEKLYYPVTSSQKDSFAKPMITVVDGGNDVAVTDTELWVKAQMEQANNEIPMDKTDILTTQLESVLHSGRKVAMS